MVYSGSFGAAATMLCVKYVTSNLADGPMYAAICMLLPPALRATAMGVVLVLCALGGSLATVLIALANTRCAATASPSPVCVLLVAVRAHHGRRRPRRLSVVVVVVVRRLALVRARLIARPKPRHRSDAASRDEADGFGRHKPTTATRFYANRRTRTNFSRTGDRERIAAVAERRRMWLAGRRYRATCEDNVVRKEWAP